MRDEPVQIYQSKCINKIHKIQMYKNTFADFFLITKMGQHIQNMQYYDRIIGIEFLLLLF